MLSTMQLNNDKGGSSGCRHLENAAPGASEVGTLSYIQNWEFWVGTNVCWSACGGVTFLVPDNRSLVLANGSLFWH